MQGSVALLPVTVILGPRLKEGPDEMVRSMEERNKGQQGNFWPKKKNKNLCVVKYPLVIEEDAVRRKINL